MKRAKKIICTVTNDLSYDQRMIRICSSLAAAGYELTLVGRKLPNSKPLVTQDFRQKRIYCVFKKGKLFYLEYNLRLFFYLLFASYDLLCSIDLDTLLSGSWATYLRRKKQVYDAHEYFTELPEVVERPKVQAIWAWVARRCIPRLSGAYTVCDSLAQVFKNQYQRDFEVIRNVPFVREEEQSSSNLSKPYILIYQGMLNDGRGLEELLQAMQSVSADDFQLWLLGEGDLSGELRQLAADLDLGDRVKFWGFVMPQELAEITQQADIGLNLLKNKGLNYYYSLANKFFDYVQSEKPSINMAFPEYVQHCKVHKVALLLPELSATAILEALQKISTKEGLYNELKSACALAKKEWNWEKEEEKLLAFYASILK